jgi:hypothetical protein
MASFSAWSSHVANVPEQEGQVTEITVATPGTFHRTDGNPVSGASLYRHAGDPLASSLEPATEAIERVFRRAWVPVVE